MHDEELRDLVPIVIGILERRGADFSTAEDAVQDALIEAFRTWSDDEPRDMKGWLIRVAWHRFLDRRRVENARTAREEHAFALSTDAATTSADDTVDLYFLCAHLDLSPASAVALTLRAVGGLTTRQIAEAYLVPDSTMAQRISRAKRTRAGRRLNRPGNVSAVLTVLYLVFNEGYSGDVDLAAEAIRLTRVLADSIDHPEVSGLLALMLIHHARREARFSADGGLITLGEQDRSRWDAQLIAEGIGILQTALARDELGEFQVQAAIAALHADAQRVEDTDWPQIVEWYDELLKLHDSPIASLNRAVAIGEAEGPAAGLAELRRLDDSLPRYFAVEAHLRERAGEADVAAKLYAKAAGKASNLAERDHLVRQAARLNSEH
ncbi:MAG: RNA polymerase subunit sigma-24 [Brevibacterium sp.]|nr:RNA polymerase subunit sigma-24 [Brevibacterium sp.]